MPPRALHVRLQLLKKKKKRKKQLHLLTNSELFSWSSSWLMFDTASSGTCENLRKVKQNENFTQDSVCQLIKLLFVTYHVWSSRALLLHVLRALTWENGVRLYDFCLQKLILQNIRVCNQPQLLKHTQVYPEVKIIHYLNNRLLTAW